MNARNCSTFIQQVKNERQFQKIVWTIWSRCQCSQLIDGNKKHYLPYSKRLSWNKRIREWRFEANGRPDFIVVNFDNETSKRYSSALKTPTNDQLCAPTDQLSASKGNNIASYTVIETKMSYHIKGRNEITYQYTLGNGVNLEEGELPIIKRRHYQIVRCHMLDHYIGRAELQASQYALFLHRLLHSPKNDIKWMKPVYYRVLVGIADVNTKQLLRCQWGLSRIVQDAIRM